MVLRDEGTNINGGILDFLSPNFNHSGLYTCLASNNISSIVAATFVTFQGEFFPDKQRFFPKLTKKGR